MLTRSPKRPEPTTNLTSTSSTSTTSSNACSNSDNKKRSSLEFGSRFRISWTTTKNYGSSKSTRPVSTSLQIQKGSPISSKSNTCLKTQSSREKTAAGRRAKKEASLDELVVQLRAARTAAAKASATYTCKKQRSRQPLPLNKSQPLKIKQMRAQRHSRATTR